MYDKVSDYLGRDTYALPHGQRHLISLVLWKLLASSTYAIAQTLTTLALRLEAMLLQNGKPLPGIDFDGTLDDESVLPSRPRKKLTAEDMENIKREIAELRENAALAASIRHNAKGDALLTALDTGFAKLKSLKAPAKAVIFTESRRTQEFLFGLLNERYKGMVSLYNGETKDRQAVVEDFRERSVSLSPPNPPPRG